MAARVLGGVLCPEALPMISEDLSLERTVPVLSVDVGTVHLHNDEPAKFGGCTEDSESRSWHAGPL